MENSTTQKLKARILEAIRASWNRRVLSDEQLDWTGQDLLEGLAPIQDALEKISPAGSFVAVALPNSAVQATAILSVILSGRVPVILSYQDLVSDPLAWIEKSGANALIAPSGIFAQVLKIAMERTHLIGLSKKGEIELLHESRSATTTQDARAQGAALILFTSGSTGQPKGILIPEKGLLLTIDDLIHRFELNATTIAPMLLPICHSMALNTQFLPTLLAGGRCHFVNPRLDLNRLYRRILAEGGNFVSLIGETLQVCAQERRQRQLPQATEVRHVQLAGGLIAPRHIAIAKELFPNAVIHKGYGLTEAIRVTMSSSLDPGFESDSVGKPLPFVELQIRDSEGRAIESGQSGEIFVKGPNVLLGILNSKSGASLPEDGFLATGDIGHLNERNELCVSGRADGILKINGTRVSTFGIEQIVQGTSEAITHAKCVALEDPRRGIKMVLLLEIPHDLQDGFLRDELERVEEEMSRKLRTFPHFPREIAIVHRFPRTQNGKLAMGSLKELYLSSNKSTIQNKPESFLQFFRITAA